MPDSQNRLFEPQPSAREIAEREVWRRGIVEPFLRPEQKRIWEHLQRAVEDKDCYKFNILCHRGLGKSSVCLLFAWHFAFHNPKSIIRYFAPTGGDVDEIVSDLIPELFESCPEDLQPERVGYRKQYRLPNNGILYFKGTDDKKGNKIRGRRADLIILDEAGQAQNLLYLWRSVIFPVVERMDGLCAMLSTPPSLPGHEYGTLTKECIEAGYHVEIPIGESQTYSPQKQERMCAELGGPESIDWQREYLLHWVIDSDIKVVPEFDDHNILPDKFDPNQDTYYHLWHKYVGGDMGFRDLTAFIFGYYRREDATLYIIDEISLKSVRADQIVEAVDIKEKELWGHLSGEDEPPNVYLRVIDNDADSQRVGADLSYHGKPVLPTDKESLEKMIGKLGMWCREGRIKIHPRCEKVIGCLRDGVWQEQSDRSNARRTFARTPALGHLDHLAALTYLVRNIDEHTNPVPKLYSFNKEDVLLHEDIPEGDSFDSFYHSIDY